MFTVVIPAYNSAKFLKETLSTIRDQTRPPQKVIVVDDGSTDATADIARSYAPLVDCIQVENGGQGLARRLGIAQARTEWIALCDSDDVWRRDHLERRHQLIEQIPAVDFTFSDFYSFGDDMDDGYTHLDSAPKEWITKWAESFGNKFFTIRQPYLAFLDFNPAYLSGIAFRRDAYDKMGGFLAKYSRWIGEDSEFVRRFMLLPGVVVAGDKAQTWGYRRHEDNYSRAQWKNVYARSKILQEHADAGLIPPEFAARVIEEIERARIRAFDIAYWEKQYRDVLEIYPALPACSRTIRRKLKRLISWTHSGAGRKNYD